MILLLRMGCGVVEITNPSSFSFVLTNSYLAAGGDVQPMGQNSLKDVVERWPGGVKTHDVEYMWSCRKDGKYGSKKLNNNQDRDAKFNKHSTSVLEMRA